MRKETEMGDEERDVTAELDEFIDLRVEDAERAEEARGISCRIRREVAGRVREARSARLDELLDQVGDSELADCGVTWLPTDASGRPWRVGDLLETGSGRTLKVTSRILDDELGWLLRCSGSSVVFWASKYEHAQGTADRIRECANDLCRGRLGRPDPRFGEDLTTSVVYRLDAIADDIDGEELL